MSFFAHLTIPVLCFVVGSGHCLGFVVFVVLRDLQGAIVESLLSARATGRRLYGDGCPTDPAIFPMRPLFGVGLPRYTLTGCTGIPAMSSVPSQCIMSLFSLYSSLKP